MRHTRVVVAVVVTAARYERVGVPRWMPWWRRTCAQVRVTHRRGIGGEQGMAQQRPTHVLRCKEYRLVG